MKKHLPIALAIFISSIVIGFFWAFFSDDLHDFVTVENDECAPMEIYYEGSCKPNTDIGICRAMILWESNRDLETAREEKLAAGAVDMACTYQALLYPGGATWDSPDSNVVCWQGLDCRGALIREEK